MRARHTATEPNVMRKDQVSEMLGSAPQHFPKLSRGLLFQRRLELADQGRPMKQTEQPEGDEAARPSLTFSAARTSCAICCTLRSFRRLAKVTRLVPLLEDVKPDLASS